MKASERALSIGHTSLRHSCLREASAANEWTLCYGGMDYTSHPCPPNIGPFPVHPHLSMHSCLRPGDHMGSEALKRLPKKLHTELKHDNDPPMGWVVYIVEGYDWVVGEVV